MERDGEYENTRNFNGGIRIDSFSSLGFVADVFFGRMKIKHL